MVAVPSPHGGLGFVLEVVPAVEVKEKSGEAAVPGREEVNRCSDRSDLEYEEEWAKATVAVRGSGASRRSA
jgi:hypothetical protein